MNVEQALEAIISSMEKKEEKALEPRGVTSVKVLRKRKKKDDEEPETLDPEGQEKE